MFLSDILSQWRMVWFAHESTLARRMPEQQKNGKERWLIQGKQSNQSKISKAKLIWTFTYPPALVCSPPEEVYRRSVWGRAGSHESWRIERPRSSGIRAEVIPMTTKQARLGEGREVTIGWGDWSHASGTRLWVGQMGSVEKWENRKSRLRLRGTVWSRWSPKQ